MRNRFCEWDSTKTRAEAMLEWFARGKCALPAKDGNVDNWGRDIEANGFVTTTGPLPAEKWVGCAFQKQLS